MSAQSPATTPFLRRVRLRNYKSIAYCDVTLSSLAYLVGPNGAGKSNFLNALQLVSEALAGSLEAALSTRGGFGEVRRKSGGRPNNCHVRLDFTLPSGQVGMYAFKLAAPQGTFSVQEERCQLGINGSGPGFHLRDGELVSSSETSFPAVLPDRLALVAAAGLPAFRPAFDSLSRMGFYNLNPKVIRDPQVPMEHRMLKAAGENLAGVLGQMSRNAPLVKQRLDEYLRAVVPAVHGVDRLPLGGFETLEFRQDVADSKHPWKFQALNMSDGTLRALGILVALFQTEMQSNAASLIGIEEPETALHPRAAATLRSVLKEAAEHTQVIVTSHSPELLDDPELDSQHIHVVMEQDSSTVILPVDAASRQLMRDKTFSAGELLRLNQLEPDEQALLALTQQQQLKFDFTSEPL